MLETPWYPTVFFFRLSSPRHTISIDKGVFAIQRNSEIFLFQLDDKI